MQREVIHSEFSTIHIRKIHDTLMGSIDLHEDAVTKRQIAVKTSHFIRRRRAEDPIREILILRSLTTVPRISVFRACEMNTKTVRLYVDYIPGKDLLHYAGTFKEDKCKYILFQLAQTLSALHDHGYMHMDVSMENIILCEQTPFLIDFGMAQPIVTEQKVKKIFGKARHICPEFLKHKTVSPLCDVYGFGTVAMALVMGQFPFDHVLWENNSFLQFYEHQNWKPMFAIRTFRRAPSIAFINFVKQLLCPRKRRLTMRNVVDHPYFADMAK